jgi:hypothetical protein
MNGPRHDPDLGLLQVPPDDASRIVSDAYRAHNGRAIDAQTDAQPARVCALIARHGTRRKNAIVWHYRSLVAELGGDHRLAQASLPEIGGRLRWLDDGTLILDDAD